MTDALLEVPSRAAEVLEKDETIQAVTAVWTDHLMAHYITRTGAHEQVRLDRMDWKRSAELNRSLGRIPEGPQGKPEAAVSQ